MNYLKILSFVLILLCSNFNHAISDSCEDEILEVKTTSVPDEFQANVILNSFLKDQIIDDMTSWFIESHFPFGNSTAWHKVNLETSTIDLIKHGINEKLLMVYYQSQNYCGIGGQCSTYLLRQVDGEWQEIEFWHEVKWLKAYINSCEANKVFILLDEGREYAAPGPHHGRLINIEF
tara:strand:- start:873 stop:1403 length:531 start_codon:yes stop_codon:yes gene_type:complete